mgnify:CR=1 FL=1
MAVLTCEKLNYRYSVGTPFETAALQDVSFSVEKGEIVGIIGHTGSGKSTLIQHLNGLIEPQSGKVYVDGADIWSKQNRKQIRRVRFQVGLCFQYPEYQIFEEDVYKEIAFGPKQMGLDSEEIRRRVFHSMDWWVCPVILRNSRPLICPVGKSAVWPLRPFWQWSQRF